MSSKRQTTMAKMKREQSVRERRVRKQEKKDERKRAAAELKATGTAPEGGTFDADGYLVMPVDGLSEVQAPVPTPVEAPTEAPDAARVA
jgi:hypothetical protein